MTAPSGGTLTATVCEDLGALSASDWDALGGAADPCLSHAFLGALERHGCVGGDSGWWPHHLLLHAGERLIGALPMYLKAHSQGEFVFDWSWADAWERAGHRYYPKLVCAVPFTPATGHRLLLARGQRRHQHARALAARAVEIARRSQVSSLHLLFCREPEAQELAGAGWLVRTGCQFHWHNPGYRDFTDYLGALDSKRRKQVRRERRMAAAAPVEIEIRHGDEAGAEHWQAYHRLYASTYDRKWGRPSLNPELFIDVAHAMPRRVLLVLARRGADYVAGAHCLVGDDTLYGRNWGCSEFHPALHFEMCYYRLIEYCIEHGLRRFDAGAQGEHKLARGFAPMRTWSAHWIADRGFRAAIGEFLDQERVAIDQYIEDARRHLPLTDGPGVCTA